MKKIILLISALCVLLAFSSCSNGSSDDDDTSDTGTEIVGTWSLKSVVETDGTSYPITAMSSTFVFNKENTFGWSFCNDTSDPENNTDTDKGIWAYSNNTYTITGGSGSSDPFQAATVTISNSTLSVPIEFPEVGNVVLTYYKK